MFLLFIGLSLYLWYRGEKRSMATLYRWAEDCGFAVVSAQRRWFFQGFRWWWRASDRQRVYDVVLLDHSGTHRHAEVCVGGWLVGSLSDEVQAHFRDP